MRSYYVKYCHSMYTKVFLALVFAICYGIFFTITIIGALNGSHSYLELIVRLGGISIVAGTIAFVAEPLTNIL